VRPVVHRADTVLSEQVLDAAVSRVRRVFHLDPVIECVNRVAPLATRDLLQCDFSPLLEGREEVLHVTKIIFPSGRSKLARFARNAEPTFIIDSIASNHPSPSSGDLKSALSWLTSRNTGISEQITGVPSDNC
jgi:hypothetical protein